MPSPRSLALQMMLLRGQPKDPTSSIRRVGTPGFRVRPQAPALLSGGIACELLRLIAAGQLRPGTAIPSERRLADAAGVSRVSVRQGVDFLKREGVLVARRGDGTKVAFENQPDEPIRRLTQDYMLTLSELADIAEMLLPWAAAQAAMQPEASSLINCDTADLSDEPPDVQDFEFHQAIAAASGSPFCQHIFRALSRPLRAVTAGVFSTELAGPRGGIRCRANILSDAISKQNPAAAGVAAQQYFAAVKEAFRVAPKPPEIDDETILKAICELPKQHVVGQVTEALKSLLHVEHIRPNDRLPSERALADQLGVSRVSVRAALRTLRQEGWIESAERSGTRFVARRSAPDGLVPAYRSSHRTLRDVCELRALVEPWAVRRAARRAEGPPMTMLKRVLADTSRADRPERMKSNDDMRFHRTVAELSGSAVHLYIAEVTRETLADYFDYSINQLRSGKESDSEVHLHHSGIVRHIERGEGDLAAGWQIEHSRVFQDAYSQVA